MSSTNSQFAQGVYDFQMEVFKMMLDKFDGKVVGSDDFNLEKLKETFFEDYTPGKKAKKATKVKKATKAKKPRALSGYTFFGMVNKEAFNEEMEKPLLDALRKQAKQAGASQDDVDETGEEVDEKVALIKLIEANGADANLMKEKEKPRFVTFVGKKWKALSDEEQKEWNEKAKSDFESKQTTETE